MIGVEDRDETRRVPPHHPIDLLGFRIGSGERDAHGAIAIANELDDRRRRVVEVRRRVDPLQERNGRILGIVEASAEEKAAAAPRALMASRTNLLLSLPMLYCMVSANLG